ncbi:MAG: VWA domain-containing protein [Deltaproteobacteria bacterium]|nr:VWA domain-containing protein [Deltaproteobacteria bacterium]
MRPISWLVSLSLALFGLVLLPVAVHAATETVLVLDNSGSMITESRSSEGRIPPADPDRLAILGTLVLQQVQDPADRLHILNFDEDAPYVRTLPGQPSAIREMLYDAPTLFRGVLGEARRILSASSADRRLLIFLTDGLPSDENFSMDEAARLLGLDTPPVPFDIVIFGLAADAKVARAQKDFLSSLTGSDGDLVTVADPGALVTGFTDAYAAQLGSRPETGVLKPGGSYTVDVGKYVTEVLVISASSDRAGPYQAEVRRDSKTIPEVSSGDNGCSAPYNSPSNPRLCKPPFHHYRVWKADNNPKKESRWTLSVDGSAKSDVAFGFILRYELAAELVGPPSKVRVGEPFEAVGRITWRGKTFDAEDFFRSDGFEAVAVFEGREVPLVRRPDSSFAVSLTAAQLGGQSLSIVFRNRWMRLRADTTVMVEGYLPLDLSVAPVDFGAWRGDGRAIEECRPLVISGNNAGRVPLDVVANAVPEGAALTLAGLDFAPGDVASVPPGGAPVPLCVRSVRCCDAFTGAEVALSVRGQDPHYHSGAVAVPVQVDVAAAGFYRCWTWVIWTALGVLGLLVILVGLIRPKDFMADQRLKVAGSERKLTRASAMVLREQPGGRRGFYRNATVGLDAQGTPVGARSKAWLRLTAGGGGEIAVASGGTLEVRDRRTRKWEPVNTDAGPAILRRRVEYRVADLYFRIE